MVQDKQFPFQMLQMGIQNNGTKASPQSAGQTSEAICVKLQAPKGLSDPIPRAFPMVVAWMASLLGW